MRREAVFLRVVSVCLGGEGGVKCLAVNAFFSFVTELRGSVPCLLTISIN